MKIPEINYIKSRLYLHAVIPGMAELVHLSEEAKEIVRNRDFSILLKIRGAGSEGHSALSFKDGTCRSIGSEGIEKSRIELLFSSDNHLVRVFEHETKWPPLPVKGFTRIKDLKTFNRMGELLDRTLKPSKRDLEDKKFAQTHTDLSFYVACASISQLIKHDKISRELLKKSPTGLIEFQIEDPSRKYWVNLNWPPRPLQKTEITEPEPGEKAVTWGKGSAPAAPDVRIRFKSTAVALAGLQDKIDGPAEVGAGNICVEGLIPLADCLNQYLVRLQKLLVN